MTEEHEDLVDDLARYLRRRGMLCDGCRAPHGMYMLTDEVWLKANRGRKYGRLCIQCAATRLARPLTANDFTDAPCNDVIHYAFKHRNP